MMEEDSGRHQHADRIDHDHDQAQAQLEHSAKGSLSARSQASRHSHLNTTDSQPFSTLSSFTVAPLNQSNADLDRVKHTLQALRTPESWNDTRGHVVRLRQELARAVECLESERANWHKKDTQQSQLIQTLLAERDQLQQNESLRNKALTTFERELQQAVVLMGDERKKWQEEKERFDKERLDLVQQATSAAEKVVELERQHDADVARIDKLEQENFVLDEKFESGRKALLLEREELQNDTAKLTTEIELLRNQHTQEMRLLKERVDGESLANADLKNDKIELESEVRRLRLQQSILEREKASATQELLLAQQKHEKELASVADKLESDIQQRVKEARTKEKALMEEREEDLQRSFDRKLGSLLDSHRAQINNLQADHAQVVADLEGRIRALKAEAEKHSLTVTQALSRQDEVITSLKAQLQRQFTLRNDLAAQLQGVVKQYSGSMERVLSRLAIAESEQLLIDTSRAETSQAAVATFSDFLRSFAPPSQSQSQSQPRPGPTHHPRSSPSSAASSLRFLGQSTSGMTHALYAAPSVSHSRSAEHQGFPDASSSDLRDILRAHSNVRHRDGLSTSAATNEDQSNRSALRQLLSKSFAEGDGRHDRYHQEHQHHRSFDSPMLSSLNGEFSSLPSSPARAFARVFRGDADGADHLDSQHQQDGQNAYSRHSLRSVQTTADEEARSNDGKHDEGDPAPVLQRVHVNGAGKAPLRDPATATGTVTSGAKTGGLKRDYAKPWLANSQRQKGTVTVDAHHANSSDGNSNDDQMLADSTAPKALSRTGPPHTTTNTNSNNNSNKSNDKSNGKSSGTGALPRSSRSHAGDDQNRSVVAQHKNIQIVDGEVVPASTGAGRQNKWG